MRTIAPILMDLQKVGFGHFCDHNLLNLNDDENWNFDFLRDHQYLFRFLYLHSLCHVSNTQRHIAHYFDFYD